MPFKKDFNSSNDNRGSRSDRNSGRDDNRRSPRTERSFDRDDNHRGSRSDRPASTGSYRRDERPVNPFDKPKRFDNPSESNDTTREHRNYGSREVKVVRKLRPRKKNMSNNESADDGSIRLNRYLSNAGICSRREADDLIRSGVVTVNGVVVSEMGVKVKLEDDVRYNGERLSPENKVYIIVNKPKDYVTTLDDPNAKKTVMELIHGACKERVYPVGRLDRMTTGVLLLTNDGDLTKKLTHPKHEKKKIYHVFLDRNLKKTDMDALAGGFDLEDGFIKADIISYVNNKKDEIGIEIHSGRNRIVRRMFEHLDYKVKKLDRVYFAGLTKKGLSRGHWRFLNEKEIQMLKMGAYE